MNEKRKYYILNIVIFASFLIVTAFNAHSNASEVLSFTREKEMPALGIAAYSRLNNSADFYKRAGKNLLQGDFIRNWIIDGEMDPEELVFFMEEIRQKYGLLDASLVSDLTETYYGTDGRVLKLSPENTERDGWYYHYRESVGESNIDSWYYPESGVVGLYVNIPVNDYEGNFIGVTGGGVDSSVFDRLLKSLEHDWKINIYMVRNDGQLVYATENQLLEPPVRMLDSIWSSPVLDKISREKNNSAGIVLQPEGEAGPVLWAGYMEEWETFLIIERDSKAMAASVRSAVLGSLLSGGLLTLSLFFLALALLRVLSLRDDRRVVTGRSFVNKLQSVIYIQNLLLGNAETTLKENGAQSRGIELEERRKALELMMTVGRMEGLKVQVNLNEVIEDLMLRKSADYMKRRITLHSRLSARQFVVSGNDILISLVLEYLLDKAAVSSADESEIVVLSGSSMHKVSIDIAFPSGGEGESGVDVSMLLPVLSAMDVSLEIDKPRSGGLVFHLEFQISGE